MEQTPAAADEQDRALVRRYLEGQQDAAGGLVDRYQKRLFNVALRMLDNAQDAEDVTQTVFLNAFLKLSTYDPRFRFFSWIYRILVNECLNVQRDRRPHEPITPEVAAVGSPADLLEASERRARLHAAVLALPSAYREVVVLRYFGELTYEAIADATGVPVKTVKSRLFTARQRLASLLDLDSQP